MMKLADWFRAKKQEWFGQRTDPEETHTGVQPLDVDLSGIEPPETRFTEEYQAFLEQQETTETEDS